MLGHRVAVSALWIALIILSGWVTPSDVHAQRLASRSVEELSRELQASVMAADAQALMSQAAESIEIELFGERRFYSRGQATLLLNDLFEDSPTGTSRVIRSHRTPSAAFIELEIASSQNASAATWLVRYALRRGEWRIRELTVEVADE